MSNVQTSTITFKSIVEQINDILIVRLPADISSSLPSRGQVAMEGTINSQPFTTVLEPDGNWGHWLNVSSLDISVEAGDDIFAKLTIATSWPEPTIPTDLEEALRQAPPDIKSLWSNITPMARWEWVRWVNATANPDTRQRRVEVSISKMQHGKRRPCCFNLAACTDPSVSKSGRLLNSVS